MAVEFLNCHKSFCSFQDLTVSPGSLSIAKSTFIFKQEWHLSHSEVVRLECDPEPMWIPHLLNGLYIEKKHVELEF